MHKRELIARLGSFAEPVWTTDMMRWKGQKSFAKYLIYYLTKLEIPSDEKYDFWRIEPYLPQILVDVFEELRTANDPRVVEFRKMYEDETGHEVPNIPDVGETRLLERGSAVQTTLGFMMREIFGGEWLEKEIEAYCNAELYVLQQTFDKFIRLVYRKGLYDFVDKSPKRGMSGKFGETELRTFIMAGRVMFTFARKIDKKRPGIFEKGGKIYSNENDISFVGEDGDSLGYSAGIQSLNTDFLTALDMMNDVIKGWPAEAGKQWKIHKGGNVSIL